MREQGVVKRQEARGTHPSQEGKARGKREKNNLYLIAIRNAIWQSLPTR